MQQSVGKPGINVDVKWIQTTDSNTVGDGNSSLRLQWPVKQDRSLTLPNIVQELLEECGKKLKMLT